MSRLVRLCVLIAAAAITACAAPTSPGPRRQPARPAQEDTTEFCGWPIPNGRC